MDCFAYRNKAKGTLQSHCRDCHRAYRRDHYAANADKYKRKAKNYKGTRREANTALLLDFLADHPCVDCGESDPVVLQFDHVRGEKSYDIARKMDTMRWDRILIEIKKCDVRCANCHTRQTASRAGWLRAAKVFTDTCLPSKQE